MSALQAVLFDIDDTLFSTSDFAERARRNAVQAMILNGLKIDPEEALRELQEVISEFSSNYSSHFDKLLTRIPESRYRGINPAILIAAGVIGYHETKSELHPYPDVVNSLRRLSGTHLVLGVVSAGLQIKQAEKLLRLGVYPFFDPEAIFISDQIGISKPNPKIYLHACSRLGVQPSKVLYVGDNPTHDIDPCNRLGIATVRCRRGTRHSDVEGETKADHEIQSFEDLLAILEREFGMEIPELDSVPLPATLRRARSSKARP